MKFEELQAKIGAAKTPQEAASVIAEYNKTRKDEAAAIQAAIVKENEELAGAREALATQIYNQINKQSLVDKLGAVKATGFTYKLNAPDANGIMVEYKSVALTVPVAKAKKTAVSTGTRGASRDLNAIFEATATAEDKVKMSEAEAKDLVATAKLGRTTNSNAWRIKDIVAKRIGS